jgi:Iap family predicted aminopeptidase
MRPLLLVAVFCLAAHTVLAQSPVVKEINRALPAQVALAPLHFLASDELMGRGTTRPEIHIAARYISEQFRSFSLKELQGTKDYFQTFELKFVRPTRNGQLSVNNMTYKMGDEVLSLAVADRNGISAEGPLVYVGDGREADFEKTDVKGKIVVMELKSNDSTTFMQGFQTINNRTKVAVNKGAAAVLVRYNPAAEVSWSELQHYFNNEYLYQEPATVLPVYLLNDSEKSLQPFMNAGAQSKLQVGASDVVTTAAKNVMGYVEGTDPKLKNQFLMLTAHYDHVGIADKPKMEEGKLDSIYNGARDNAIGVTAVINAARYFATHPPKRSVLFIAYTGEELGLLGSRYFAEHPTVRINQIVYNLNIDNASYNDTSRVTVIGLGRTSADADIEKASKAFGLTAMPDPAPEQNLFDRSDNVSMAAKGIPAPTYSLGIKKFDETITNRYHQLSDEVGNMDLNYAMKYIKSFILAARNIADNPVQPRWKKGDKYEAAWEALYLKPF